ncbi:MAG: hypothetical protein LBC18_03050 [Opitutaceae bacterium]|jgi:hypothetical protein|nr:hypothetical protein [Opitutaceae bacterium]
MKPRRDTITTTLTPDALAAFCAELAALPPGQRTLERIRTGAQERGVGDISLMSATNFRDGTLADYLLEKGAQPAEPETGEKSPMTPHHDTLSSTLAQEDLDAFCGAIVALPPGQRTLARIRALASARGISISRMSASNFRDGTLADYVSRLRAKADRAREIAAVQSGGKTFAEAAETLLAADAYDLLSSDDARELTPKERETYSRILARARAGDDRARKLESDLALARERLAALERDRSAATAIAGDTKLTPEERERRIKEVFGIR